MTPYRTTTTDLLGASRGVFANETSDRIVQLVRTKPVLIALPTEEHVTVCADRVLWTGGTLQENTIVCVMHGTVTVREGLEPVDDKLGNVYWLGSRVIYGEIFSVNLETSETPPFCKAQYIRQTANDAESNCYLAAFNAGNGHVCMGLFANRDIRAGEELVVLVVYDEF